MATVFGEDQQPSDPAGQLPAYLDQVRRLHTDLFVDYCGRVRGALERIGGEPGCPYHDQTNAQLALRYVRLALANFDPPLTEIALREIRRDKLLDLFDACQDRVRELLRDSGDAQVEVERLYRNLTLAAVLFEMVCLMVEKSDLATNPTEGVIDTISWMIDYAGSVAGDAKMRERDEDVTTRVRLANLKLEELAMPIIMRLSETHALLERHCATSPAHQIREV